MRRPQFWLPALLFAGLQAASIFQAASVAAAPGGYDDKPGAPPAPLVVRAPSWILMDVDTGRILEKHNANQRMFPASTTKTLMALTAIRSGRMDVLSTIGPNPPKTGESSIGLLQGERFTVRDLTRAALIKSANDACVAVAEGVSGTVPAFVKQMNIVSKEVGANDSHWMNPHGLHDPNHYTTAHDLALIARAALQDPWFNETVRIKDMTMPGNAKVGPLRALRNRNRLLFRWAECDGVKTGYTRQAGRCLIATATRTMQTARGPRPFRLLSVVLHAPDSWGDCRNLLEKVGFARFHPQELAQQNQEFGTINVEGGAFDAHAITPRPVEMALRSTEHVDPAPRVQLFHLRAPVKQGQIIGRVSFYDGAKRLAQVPLESRDEVPVGLAARVFPPARSLPSNTPIRFLIIGSAAGSLALLLIWFKLRSQEPKTAKIKGANHDTRTETKAEFYARLEAEREAKNRPAGDVRRSPAARPEVRTKGYRSTE